MLKKKEENKSKEVENEKFLTPQKKAYQESNLPTEKKGGKRKR